MVEQVPPAGIEIVGSKDEEDGATSNVNAGNKKAVEVVDEETSQLAKLEKRFLRNDPTKFTGELNLELAEEWILQIEKRKRTLKINDTMIVQLALNLIEGKAYRWWRTMEKVHGEIKEWTKFKELFYEQYFSKAVQDERMTKFISLVQGYLDRSGI